MSESFDCTGAQLQGGWGYYPPLWVVDWEAQVVHDSVCMVALVGVDLHAHGKALKAQVKVRAHVTFDADHVGDVLLAVVAVVQRPAQRRKLVITLRACGVALRGGSANLFVSA